METRCPLTSAALGGDSRNQRQVVSQIRCLLALLSLHQMKVFSGRSNTRRRIDTFPSNSQNDSTPTREQSETSTEFEEKKQRLVSAKRLFKKLARSYLKKRAPPDPESMRELWEYKDILDLKTVFTWRDEVGIRRGVLYEDGKIEFEEWPLPPHEDIIDLFEIIFRRQFISPWPSDLNPTFDGIHSQGEDTLFLEDYINDARYKLPWEKETAR